MWPPATYGALQAPLGSHSWVAKIMVGEEGEGEGKCWFISICIETDRRTITGLVTNLKLPSDPMGGTFEHEGVS